jgi:hypothetical protein
VLEVNSKTPVSKRRAQWDKLGLEGQRDSFKCQGNQALIYSACQAYKAQYGVYPPNGVIDRNHPLVTRGFLSSVPACPSTGAKYVISRSGKNKMDPTTCPSDIYFHDHPL